MSPSLHSRWTVLTHAVPCTDTGDKGKCVKTDDVDPTANDDGHCRVHAKHRRRGTKSTEARGSRGSGADTHSLGRR